MLRVIRYAVVGIMAQANLSADAGKHNQILAEVQCVVGRAEEIHKQIIFLPLINIFLSFTAFLGNTLILVALYKKSSLHPPSKLLYRCLVATDLCVGLISEPSAVIYWMSLLYEDSNLCLYAYITNFVAAYTLSSVSLLTMTAISVDRLLALLLSLSYRQVVTLKRTYLFLIILWIVSIIVGTSYFFNSIIPLWYAQIGIPLSLVTATFSYAKIFHRFHHNQNQVHVLPQQPSQPVPINMARYRKAVYGAIWVQLALVLCYLPYGIAIAVLSEGRLSLSEFIVLGWTETLVFLNSSLNPFLYCWKFREVRQAVRETIRQTPCCSWS